MSDTAFQEINVLGDRITKSTIPDDLKNSVSIRLEQLKKLTNSPTFLPEYDRMNKYVDWITNLPWSQKSQDNLDLVNAKKILDEKHFGLEDIKDRVLEYLSVMKLKQEKGEAKDIYRAP